MEGEVTKSKTRTLIAMFAVSAVAACSTNRSYVAGGDVDLSTAVPAELDAGEVTFLGQMSDGNILGHLMVVDSFEVTLSDTALYHLKTDQVTTYAKLMHLAHNDDWKALKDLAASTAITPTVDVTGLKSSHLFASIDSVRKTSDMTKDQLYIRQQIELHQHALAELQVLQGVARNTALRQHITVMIPVVRDHLARAKAIGRTIGVD